ncbi:hypothetical protein LXL04_009473 [Taraxacum kok-saghyz]
MEVNEPPIINVDEPPVVDVDDGDDEEVADNKGGGHKVSWIRNAVKYVRSSGARFATFLECVEKVKITCSKKPSLDVDTRWNSTFLMLESAEKYEAAFDRLLVIDGGYKTFCGSEIDDGEVSTRKRIRNEKVAGVPDADDWVTYLDPDI